jgi:hypothetical protein
MPHCLAWWVDGLFGKRREEECEFQEGVDGGIGHMSYIFNPHLLFGFTSNSL